MKKLILLSVCLFSINAFAQDHFLLGNQLFLAGKYNEAIDEYLQARLTVDSTDAELYFNIGMAKTQLAQFPSAISYFTTAVTIRPDYKEAFYRRGLAKEETGDHAGAIYDYTKALGISEKYEDARFERGYSKTNNGDYASAVEDFTFYINQHGTHLANAYYERAAAKNRLMDYTGALADLEQATSLGLKDKLLYYETAYATEGNGEFLKAIDIYTKVIAADPNYASAYYRRGYTYLALNNKEAACKDIRRSYELGFAAAKDDLDKTCK